LLREGIYECRDSAVGSVTYLH